MRFYFIIFIIISCNVRKNSNYNKETCRLDFDGSVVIFNDSNNTKRFFYIRLNDSISRALLSNYSESKEKDSIIFGLYSFFKTQEIKSLDILEHHTKKYYEYFLDSSKAPVDVINEIRKNEEIICDYSGFARSNTIWYCLNGYLPSRCCDEAPPKYFINKRKCLGMDNYTFKID